VWYRGTDKFNEVKIAPPELYVSQVRRILIKNPGLKVWIQTDQAQVREMFLNEFGTECLVLDELPVTSGTQGIHFLGSSLQDLVLLLCAAMVMSTCRFVVLHTGNVATWICLYRGHSKRLIQFGHDATPIYGTFHLTRRYLYRHFITALGA
jgi:hypothetical protein